MHGQGTDPVRPAWRRIRVRVTACYLVPEDGGWLLVDTGLPAHYAEFRARLARAGVDIRELRDVLLTHHHYDHAGLAAEVLRDSGARLIVHEAAVPLLAEGRSRLAPPLDPSTGSALAAHLPPGRGRYRAVRLPEGTAVLQGDDDRLLRERGIAGRVLHTPGHSPDGLTVLLDDGTAFPGDAVMNLRAIPGTAPLPVLLEDRAQLFRSWEKLASGGVRRLYPAHGGPLPAEALKECCERMRHAD